jgi:ABC-2 type transport system permease protein
LQVIAWTLPPTYVFEGMRALLLTHVFRADLMLAALSINIALITLRFSLFSNTCRRRDSMALCCRAANKPR